MFIIKYYKKDKPIGEKSFATQSEAENNYDQSDYYDKADYYEIIDSETSEVVDESEIMSDDEILDDMFDDEDSKAGYNWTQD